MANTDLLPASLYDSTSTSIDSYSCSPCQRPHTYYDITPKDQLSQGDIRSPNLVEKRVAAKTDKKRRPQIIFNVSNTRYDVIKYVGEVLFQWRLSYESRSDWDVLWTDFAVEPETLARMHAYQKINHFPGMYCLARKNHLGKHLMRMRKAFPEEYKFFPETYLLPAEYNELRMRFATGASTYIVKPEASCQGRGIFLTRTLDNIQPGERYVVQKYLSKPYLIDGLKFDLRIYVLLAGCDPLRIYIYKDGLCRLATEKYVPPTGKNLENMCMHLTNYAVNKGNPNFVFNTSEENDNEGHKRSLKAFMNMLKEEGHDTNLLWKEIKKLIIKTFCSVQPLLAHNYRACQADDPYNNMCFEILGFDIMLDHKLKPYLLEVNHTPSFTTDTPLDRNIKKNVIRDTLKLMNISAETKYAYKKKKRVELRKRILTGKSTKITQEERKAEIEKAQKERDDWESQHLGDYEKVYPLENPSKYEENYEGFLKEATKWWESWTGTAIKRNEKKGTDPTKPMVFGLSPTNKVSGTNRDGQNPWIQKLRRPAHTARPNSFQTSYSVTKIEGLQENENRSSLVGQSSKNEMEWFPRRPEEGKVNFRTSPFLNDRKLYHPSIQEEEDYEASDKDCNGEDDDDEYTNFDQFPKQGRDEPIGTYDNNSFEERDEKGSQEMRGVSQEKAKEVAKSQEIDRFQLFKLRSSQPLIFSKEQFGIDGPKEITPSKGNAPQENGYYLKKSANTWSMNRFEDMQFLKSYTTETMVADNKGTPDEASQPVHLMHPQFLAKLGVAEPDNGVKVFSRIHSQAKHQRSQGVVVRLASKPTSSLPPPPQKPQNQVWNVVSPKKVAFKTTVKRSIDNNNNNNNNATKEAVTPILYQTTRAIRFYVRKDTSKKVLVVNNLFMNDRVISANQFSPNGMMRRK